MSDDLTHRMLWDAAQREADKGTDGSDKKFARLLWMAQILAAIEVSEAATRAVRAEAAIARVREVVRDWPVIRAWAADNGHDCPDAGKVPGRIVDAYDQAHRHGGN